VIVHDTGWFKSSFSGAANETCVEVRITKAEVGVRDSKNASGPAFSFAPASWRAFVSGLTPPR
jgi:uncharacterized protein DUF397